MKTKELKKTFNGREVRVIVRNGVEWFVARDVCDILEIQNVSQAIHGLDNDEKADICITYTSSSGTKQSRNVITVNESGLYALIFKSRKEEAKAFRKWVTSEVLPSIRKTGKYDTRDIRQKSVDARNAFTAGCKRQGLTERREYREATIATYESLFGDTEIRKAGMNRNQVLKLMALESVETYKYDCLPKDTLMLPGIKRPVKETAHLLETATGRSAAHIGTLA